MTKTMLAASIVLIGVPIVPCESQQSRPLSAEINFGVSAGTGSGSYRSSVGVSGDVLLAYRPSGALGGFVVAAGGSMQLPGSSEPVCDVPPAPCTNGFPEFVILSALAGWEWAGGTGVRVLVGPSIARSSAGDASAMQARLDLERRLSDHFGLVLSGRYTFIASHLEETFNLGALGVGFRLR